MPGISDIPPSGGTPTQPVDEAVPRPERLSGSTEDAVSRISEAVSSVAHHLGAAGDRLADASRRWTEKSCGTVCRHPLASIAVAVAAGALLSRCCSGRK